MYKVFVISTYFDLHFHHFYYSITGRSFETGAARTFNSHEDHRHSILRTVESYLERMGGFHDGHACILRAICEVRIFWM